MDFYDLRHFVKEETIEFEVKTILTERKKIHFRESEPVALSEAAGHYVIGSEEDAEKVAEVVPVNEHYKLVLKDFAARGKIYLANVRKYVSGLLQVAFRIFSDVRKIDYSIYMPDSFLEAVRKAVNLTNPRNPGKGIEEGTLYSSGGYTYAVLGRHIREEDKKGSRHFVIAGRDFYVRVARKCDPQGTEYYCAERIVKGIRAQDYRFFLAKGKLKYTEERERIAAETKDIMESLSDDTYIKVWDRYGEIERQMILKDARELGALRYVNHEREGYWVRFDIKGNQKVRLKQYAKSFQKNAILAAAIVNPYEVHREDDELIAFFKDKRDYIAKITLAESILVENEYIRCRINEEDAKKIDQGSEGYLFFSIDGDIQRMNRRREAREKIESASCPMPNLALILEGQNVPGVKPEKRHFKLSPKVKEEIFPYGSNDMQEIAIECALNTPDIMLIQGPPGTGKTTVITAILKGLNEITDSTGGIFGRNLVTAFQHDAVQNAIDRIEILGLPAIKFGRKYSESEDDIVEVNARVQGWINNRLTDLYGEHSGIEEHKKIGAFNKLYLDYMYSTNSINQTLEILERIRELVTESVSSAILTQLNEAISDLEFMTGGTNGSATKNLVRAIRRIPPSETAFEDNGWFELENAVRLLRKSNNPIFAGELELLEKMQSTENIDFVSMREIRKQLLVKVLPKENIFTTAQKKESIIRLLGRISEYLMKREESGKNGADLVVAQYIQELEENPLAVKEAILHYTSVNGATNQQVMRREIRELKGGEIEYENVLVDEAARSNPLDLFIPLSIARDRIILVGDHRQLPHIIDDRIAKAVEEGAGEDIKAETEKQLSESMFGILFKRLQQLEAKDGIKRTITLNKQYRMHPELGTFVDANFYSKYSESERVANGDPDPGHFAQNLPGIEGKACIWMDIPYTGENPGEKAQSKYRDIEAEKIARHLKQMLEADREGYKGNPAKKQLTFGVITFYREQVNHINEALFQIGILTKDDSDHYDLTPEYRQNSRDLAEIVRVGTVDAFQGMEFDIVYLSMVRSNDIAVDVADYDSCGQEKKEALEKELQGKYGFLMFENRLCVAMSRQKRALICVGDSKMLEGSQAVRAVEPLVEYFELCKGSEYGKVI